MVWHYSYLKKHQEKSMKKTFTVCIASLLSIFILNMDTHAEENFYKLGEVVVTDQAHSAESVATVHTLTAEEIRLQGVRTLDQALTLIPGVYVRHAAAGIPRIDIRGLRTRHVLLLLNGIPVQDTYDGQFDPTAIPVDHIARIKVTTGGTSVLYGPGGSAGVINIITKTGDKGVHASLFNEFGPQGYYATNATVTGGSEKVSGVASLGSTSMDAVPVSDDFEATSLQDNDDRENSDFESQTAFVGLDYAVSEKFNLGLTLNHQDGEKGVPPVTIDDKKDAFAPNIKYDRMEEFKSTAIQAAFDYTFTAPLQLRGWAFFSQGDILFNRYDDDTYSTMAQKGSYTEDATSTVKGANVQLSWLPRASDRFSLGVHAETDSWESDGFEIDKNGKAQDFSTDADLDTLSLAMEYTTCLADRVDVVVGAGFHAMDKDDGDNDEDISCMVGLGYDLTDSTRLKANWNRSVRFPSIKQLYEQDAGNPDLTAETINTWEMSLVQQFPVSTVFSVTGYVKNARDFIEKDVDDIYRNYEEYHFRGVEFEVVNNALERLTFTASAAFMTSEDKSDNSEKDELQNRPEQKFTLEGSYRFPCGLTAWLSFMHIGDQYYYSRKSPLEKAELDDFQIVNARISQSLFHDALELFVRAENLLDEDYEQSYGYPGAGRSVYAGGVLRF